MSGEELYKIYPWFEDAENKIFDKLCQYLHAPAEDGLTYHEIVLSPHKPLEIEFQFTHRPSGTGGSVHDYSFLNILFGIKNGQIEILGIGSSSDEDEVELVSKKFYLTEKFDFFVCAEANASLGKRILEITIYKKGGE